MGTTLMPGDFIWQLDVDHHVPGAWEITEPRNTGRSDEKSVLRRRLAGAIPM